ncbi:MAG: PilZ domain-containing protein [Deltaproteobacteria bacterium]|nr:PilZ domain-containing protein [Deltaproteobacteria bacterium]
MRETHHFRASRRPRVAVQVVLRRLDNPSTAPIVTYTRDVGTGGLFVVTSEDFVLGERVEVTLSTPSTWEPVALKAEVCRYGGSEGDEPGGVGLRFVDPSEEEAVVLARFVSSLDYRE